MTKELYYS